MAALGRGTLSPDALLLLEALYAKEEPVDLLELAMETKLSLDSAFNARGELDELALLGWSERELNDGSFLKVYTICDVRATERTLGLYVEPPGLLSRPSSLAGG